MVDDDGPGMDTDDAIRGETYRLLARLFAPPPDRRLLDALVAARRPETTGPVAEAWANLGEAAGSAPVDVLDGEFQDLFIGLGRGEVVPYASWYLTGFLMGRPLVALRSRLGDLGFERQEGVSEPEDHIAALFDVMGTLAAPDEGADLGVQRGFFAEFLAPWVERFMGDVQGAPSADFYAAAARLGERFAVLEKQYLGLAADDNPLRSGRAMP
ncbi:TorD/DmsD family molecular chaperone [Arhodomonas sp. SL1]|uniref:TorD/DmsD family molecular chaperone n=1 Tax=Arhodomonas sp. SL1 TaxID=3425691 RepID=UPI003F88131A